MMVAQRLDSARIVCGLSNKLTADEQGKLAGDAWERLPEPKPRLMLEVHAPDGTVKEYFLGPHTPRLRPEDVQLLHQLWLEITKDSSYSGLHHYHVLALALHELEQEMHGDRRQELLQELHKEMAAEGGPPAGQNEARSEQFQPSKSAPPRPPEGRP